MRGRVLGQRFGAAQADGQVKDLERVEKAEGFRFAADDVEGDHAAGPKALALVDGVAGRFGREMPEVVDALHLGVVGQVVGHNTRVLHLRCHAQL